MICEEESLQCLAIARLFKMYTELLFIALVARTTFAEESNRDIDSLLEQVFGPKNDTRGNSTSEAEEICTTKGAEGICVPYYTCNVQESTVTDGVAVIDIQVDTSPCRSYLDVCCLRNATIQVQSADDPGGTTSRPPLRNCTLPPFPEHGQYVVGGNLFAVPGESYQYFLVNVSCDPGYGVIGENSVLCIHGIWSMRMPQCVRFCHLDTHPSIYYYCDVSDHGIEGFRECGSQEPSGTIVRPQCRAPNYYYSGVLNRMQCIDGYWDYIAKCNPECGRVSPGGTQLLIGGRYATRGELPWHTAIYKKTTTPYMQICGGSLVTTTVVITAAHCFWSDVEKKLPAEKYAVAVGKLYRPWNEPHDINAQKSDISDIKIPKRFQGAATNFQEDIAILTLTTAVEYKTFIRPVCVDFDANFDRWQLRAGKMGKVAGWGLTGQNEGSSSILKVVDLPYIEIDECIDQSPPGFREYITSDKICAGYRNGTALCKGDSGGGLVFPVSDRGVERYYLRGIVSTAPTNEHACNAFTLTSFTQLIKHVHFITEHARL